MCREAEAWLEEAYPLLFTRHNIWTVYYTVVFVVATPTPPPLPQTGFISAYAIFGQKMGTR
jgi:hypothetical protein